MSLSRSPSPHPGGGWASPGLNSPGLNSPGLNSPYGSGRLSPQPQRSAGSSVTWESARAKSEGVNGGYPSFSTQNNGFFNRHYRKLSSSLPRFNSGLGGGRAKGYADREKLGRGRPIGSKFSQLVGALGRSSRAARIRMLAVLAFILMIILFYTTRKLLQSSFSIYID